MIIGSHRMEERVRSFQVGPEGTLTLTALLQWLQESAYQHAEALGWGYKLLDEKGLFWLLSKKKIHFFRKPHWGEVLTVTTAPYTPKGIWAPRDFLIHDSSGELLIEATSHWLLVKRDNMKPLPPLNLFGDLTFEHPEGLCNLPLGKIRGDWEESFISERHVYPSHLDVNKHMNNAYYADFIIDSLSEKQRASLKTVEMHYQQEAFSGDKISIYQGKDNTGLSLLKLHKGESAVLTARIGGDS